LCAVSACKITGLRNCTVAPMTPLTEMFSRWFISNLLGTLEIFIFESVQLFVGKALEIEIYVKIYNPFKKLKKYI
jgi:hypothetical protein